MPSTINVEIKRQSNPDAPATTEKFEVPYRPGMNITSLLGEIALNPVDVSGRATTPITYDSNCLEEICGSCAMLINGKADELLYERHAIATGGLPFSELKQRSLIDARARAADDDPNFSHLIREGLPK